MSEIGLPDEKAAIIAVMRESLTCGLAGTGLFERFVASRFRTPMAHSGLYRA
ncbi:MAG: hypothetical protein ACN6QH_16190 [Pseudomonas sp.]|uniref:hypothetical protein n=1 Tax=Pseudomonas sp. TaxID=306 RepID=UPI003D0A09B7